LLDEAATAAMALALGSSAEVSSAAHLPERITARVDSGKHGSDAATLLRVEGFGPSVVYRIEALKQLLGKAGPLEEIADEASKAIWRDIRDCIPFADGGARPVWRVSMAPSQAHHMVMALRMQAAVDAFYDWQGGLVWLSMRENDPEAGLLRGLIRKHGGGHATLVRAAPAHRAALPVFEPQPLHLAALSARLKAEFDPKHILNPGRMAPGSSSATLAHSSEGAAQ
ncbi:MAG: 2-hydroxy-acid oxidase, partial [Mesorhizobium sp.]